jgi:hypothetical protein
MNSSVLRHTLARMRMTLCNRYITVADGSWHVYISQRFVFLVVQAVT